MQTCLHSRHMSNRELAALEISTPAIATHETTTVYTSVEKETMSATTATQVNPHHNVIDLSSPEGKKLC